MDDRFDDVVRYRAGADFFWRPSTNFQLTATVHPDFGAVESDDVVINLTATETFFPEKRKAALRLWKELGYTEKEMKSVLKEELLPKIRRRRLDGTEFEDVPSTEELSMSDYSDLIDGTLRIAAEQGVHLVDPRR